MEVTPEKVEQAVAEFYRNPGKVNKECHEWLKLFQASKEAWQVVWILFDHSKPVEVQYVAANTLYYKISRCLNDIPPSEIPALKQKIVSTLAQYVAGPALVTTRLGLTVRLLQSFGNYLTYGKVILKFSHGYRWPPLFRIQLERIGMTHWKSYLIYFNHKTSLVYRSSKS